MWSEKGSLDFQRKIEQSYFGAGNNLDDDIRQSVKKYMPIPPWLVIHSIYIQQNTI